MCGVYDVCIYVCSTCVFYVCTCLNVGACGIRGCASAYECVYMCGICVCVHAHACVWWRVVLGVCACLRVVYACRCLCLHVYMVGLYVCVMHMTMFVC